MPIHDWTRVGAGIFHDFHHSWIEELKRALNAGLLPEDYYALAEQIAGPLGPDVLTLQTAAPGGEAAEEAAGEGMTAVAVVPPRVRFTAETDMGGYASRQSTVVIRHGSDDRIIALVEVVSPGNKASRHAFRKFVEKAAEALDRGFHLLILDLQPPTPRDPQGVHAAIWEEISGEGFRPPPDKPLTLVSYDAGPVKRAYIESAAVGDTLTDMPLFLAPGMYTTVPVEATYRAAFGALPPRWRRVLEG